MQVTIILSCICIVLLVSLFITVKIISRIKKINNELQKELEKQDKNLEYIFKNAEETKKIEQSRKETDTKISKAKSDEEIIDIVNDVVKSNNNRVQKRSK